MSTAVETEPRPPADAPAVRERADVVRQIKLVVIFGLVTLLVGLFYLWIDHSTVLYTLGERISKDNPAQEVNGKRLVLFALVVAAVALVLAALNKVPKGPLGMAIYLLVGIAFFVGFVIWNYADQELARPLAMINPFPGAIDLATPLVLGALAGCLCERAGVINIAIEGQLLMGAFFAAVVASLVAHWGATFVDTTTSYDILYNHSAAWGLLGGIAAGVGLAWMLGLFAMRYLVNQVVLGVVLIAFATGLTSFLLSQIPNGKTAMINNPRTLDPVDLGGLPGIGGLLAPLHDIPVIGPAIFGQTMLVYLMYLSVIVVTVMLYQTRWGLRVRSVGEHPKAADTVGIKVNRIRWQAVLFGGLFAGLGGAYFTVGSTGSFDNGASSGNGFIALAAVIMGRWHPIGASLAALFFGFMWTLQAQLQVLDKIPGELLRASPYLATIIAVAGFVGRVRPPAADGEPYVKS